VAVGGTPNLRNEGRAGGATKIGGQGKVSVFLKMMEQQYKKDDAVVLLKKLEPESVGPRGGGPKARTLQKGGGNASGQGSPKGDLLQAGKGGKEKLLPNKKINWRGKMRKKPCGGGNLHAPGMLVPPGK